MRKSTDTLTKTTAQIVKDNVCTVFNLLNFLIALALLLVQAWSNMLFILIIIINTLIGIVQELKAKRLVEKLSLLSMPTAAVIRNGSRLEITPEQIQKGDTLLLESGNVICADSIILSGVIEVNESILTGEAEPVIKRQGDTLLSGSSVISGQCQAEVIHSDEENYASKIVGEVKKYKAVSSELLQSIRKVTKFTSFLIVPLGILMFLEAYFLRGNTVYQSVISSSAGLLGMLPKGLVLLISIGLSVGVIRLSKANVLVQDLYSLENLAHCDVLCLDKTGTLTEGQMKVETVELLGDADPELVSKLIASYIAHTTDNNTTFRALKAYFKNAEPLPAVQGIPFSSERKWSSITLQDGTSFVLGAFEKLCSNMNLPAELNLEMQQGKRILFAGITDKRIDNMVMPERVTLLAAIIITDPIRKNAQSTIAYFYKQGVDVKVISGDNPVTAAAVAKRAGIKRSDSYIDMSEVDEGRLEELTDKYTVFGRVSPNQKKQLIEAMQKKKHTVAMTGDGVNDLLALKQSNCSIAIGQGSDAARQTAQLVLLDTDFSALKNVISEGRRVINNITKSAGVFFIKTIYSVFISILCVLLNAPFPFIPIQITLIDAVIEGFPAFFMSFERNDSKISSHFLDSALRTAFPNGAAITICYLVLFVAGPKLGADIGQLPLFMYLTVGAISLLGVVKASRPFNTFRLFLSIASAIGFAAAALLFSPVLQLPGFAFDQLWIFLITLALGLLITAAVSRAKIKNE